MIVNQARMLDYLLDHMQRSASKAKPYSISLHATDIEIERPVNRRDRSTR